MPNVDARPAAPAHQCFLDSLCARRAEGETKTVEGATAVPAGWTASDWKASEGLQPSWRLETITPAPKEHIVPACLRRVSPTVPSRCVSCTPDNVAVRICMMRGRKLPARGIAQYWTESWPNIPRSKHVKESKVKEGSQWESNQQPKAAISAR